MKYAICSIFLLVACLLPRTSAQDAVLSNPSNCGLNLPLADLSCPENSSFYNPNVFTIQVSGVGGTALGADVYLDEVRLLITHPWISDLNIRLRAPNGQEALLVQNVGGNGDSFGDTSLVACTGAMTLKLAACQSVNDGTPPFTSESFRALDDFYIFNDGLTSPNGDWQLLICDDLVEDTGILQYVELVFTNSNCPPVADVEVVNQDTTSISLQLNPDLNCVQAIAEIGPPGFTPGTDANAGQGQVFMVDCPEFTLTDLAADTEYELYVRRSCNGSDFTANSCPLHFQTACLPPATTAIEPFTANACPASCTAECLLNGDWQNVSGDEMNWLAATGPTPTANTGPVAGVGGQGTYLYLEANGSQCTTGAEAVLAGPCILLDKQGSEDCHWSFYYHMQGANIGSLRAEVSTDGGLSWDTRWQRNGPQGQDWQHAYVSLADYPDGALLQLRLVGTKGTGIFGDLAIDDIRLHGSQNLNFPTTALYVDADGDGFGDPLIAIPACRTSAPAGYALNGDDCDDENPNIYPGAPEIPCNGVDENCNITTIDDDSQLPPPITTNDTICAGHVAVLTAQTDPDYTVFWYADSLRASGIIGIDTLRLTDLPANSMSSPQTYTYYAEVTNFLCNSLELVPAHVLIFPQPLPLIDTLPEPCPGEVLNVASLPIRDANFTGASLSFHSAWPPTATNVLTELEQTLMADRTFYYQLVSPQACTIADSFRIELSELPQLSFSPADSFSLCRQSIDTVEAIVSGGTGSYTYLWGNGLTQASLPIQAANVAGDQQVFDLRVRDSAGCTIIDSVQITTTNSIDSLSINATPVSTCEGNDGGITIVPLNGLPPFTYQWADDAGNTGQGAGFADTIRINNLPQNAYQITLTDSSPSGCPLRLRNIRVQGPGFQLSDTEVTPPSCAGASDGMLCLDVSGNTGTLSYQWSNGQTTPCASSLIAGNYSVTISNGTCTATETYQLTQPDSIRLVSQMSLPSCTDAADGTISVSIFGGSPNYSLEWANGLTLPNRTNLAAGNYALTIRDRNACLLTDTLVLAAPAPLVLEIDTLRHVSCSGADDALVQLGASGGMAPYTFRWADGSTANLRFPLAAATYPLTITDDQACQKLDTLSIVDPLPLTLAIDNLILPVCRGDNTGEISLQAMGGTAPYIYTWSDGLFTTNAVRTNLQVGTYQMMVSDARGCKSSTLEIDLTAQSNLNLAATLTMPTCVGLENGAIDLSVGGQAPFNYEWSTGATAASLNNLGVGSYGLTITDARTCVLDTILSLTAPQVFDINSRIVSPSCFGVDDGLIDQSFIAAGTAPIQFFWNDNSQHVDRMFMPPGEYQYTVTDALGCAYVSDTFRLVYPEPLMLEVLEQGGILCAGDSSGYFETQGLGGTLPYTYTWPGTGRSGSSIYELGAGAQRLLLNDARGCSIDTLLELADPPLLSVTADLDIGNVCDLDDPDVLTAMASGGNGPYRFQWNDHSQEANLVNPSAGDYFVTVTDESGCSESFGTIKVQEKVPPLILDSFRVAQVNCFASSDAVMTAFTSGGSGQLRYHFTPTYIGETSADSLSVSGVAFDNSYSVTVTDLVTGCEVESAPVAGVQPEPLVIERDSFLPVNCFGGRDGAIFVEVFGGTGPYAYRWMDDEGTLVGTSQDLELIRAGIYHLLATDVNGCTAEYSDSNVISLGGRIFIADTVIQAVACRGDFTGGIDLRIDGGSPPYSYQWSTGAMTEDVTGIRSGLYSLTVTDSDTCRVIFPPLRVPQPASAIETAFTADPVSCFGGMDGSLTANVTGGGGPPYQYRWRRNGILIPSLTGLSLENVRAAEYELAVTDSNACTRLFPIELTEPEALLVQIENMPTGADSLSAIVEGGVEPYTYEWSTGANTRTISGLTDGSYSLTVTDANDCIMMVDYMLTASQQPLNKAGFRLYPNPVRDVLNLTRSSEALIANELNWQVTDGLGQQLGKGEWASGARDLKIKITQWPAGLYYLQLHREGKLLYTQRFVILD